MWSTSEDRERANARRAAEHAAFKSAYAERIKLPIEERIRLWAEEESDQELEEPTDLLIEAEQELRRLRARVQS